MIIHEQLEPRLLMSVGTLSIPNVIPGDLVGEQNDVDLDDFVALKTGEFDDVLGQFEAMKINWGNATDLPLTPDPYIGNDAAVYTTITGSLFIDGAAPQDVRQGAIGDCYFLAVLASIANADPDLMTHHIALLDDGTFIARFAWDDEPWIIRMDAKLPMHGRNILFAKTVGGELWVSLYEKAFAEARHRLGSYPSISVGWPSGALDRILGDCGWESEWVWNMEPADEISAMLDDGLAVTLVSQPTTVGEIVGRHAYAALYADATGLMLYNPWGLTVFQTWDQVDVAFRLVTAVEV